MPAFTFPWDICEDDDSLVTLLGMLVSGPPLVPHRLLRRMRRAALGPASLHLEAELCDSELVDAVSRAIIVSSIIKKRRGGRTYLYVATSARVEGRPRIVDQGVPGRRGRGDRPVDHGAGRCRR